MSADSTIDLSISVVCYRTPESQLKRLLDSIVASAGHLLERQTAFVSNLFLIDNSESPTLTPKILQHFKGSMENLGIKIELFHGHGNVGYGRAHNIPLNYLASDYHLMLNPDVVIEERALHRALTNLKRDTSIKLLSPAATSEDGRPLYLCKRYPSVLLLALRAFLPQKHKAMFSRRLANYEMQELAECKSPSEVKLISGCFMLAETHTLKLVGGFDGSYFLYFEDFDLSIRMGHRGRVMYAPNVKITHGGGNAARKGLWHIWKFIMSGFRFFQTHGWKWI